MTLGLLEGALDSLSAYVQSGMAAKVAALNTRYGDSLLVEPVKYYVGSLPSSIPEQPSVAFHGENWTPKEQKTVSLYVVSNITIAVFVGDDNLETRFKKLCRYALGIAELLREGESSMGYVVRFRGMAALSEQLNTPPFLQAVLVPISMERKETY